MHYDAKCLILKGKKILFFLQKIRHTIFIDTEKGKNHVK